MRAGFLAIAMRTVVIFAVASIPAIFDPRATYFPLADMVDRFSLAVVATFIGISTGMSLRKERLERSAVAARRGRRSSAARCRKTCQR